MFTEIIRITEATDLPKGLLEALERWRVRADEIIRGDEIQWYAKSASTVFTLEGKRYNVVPKDVFSPEIVEKYTKIYLDNVLHAGFEILQGMIGDDLKALGATDIQHFGWLD